MCVFLYKTGLKIKDYYAPIEFCFVFNLDFNLEEILKFCWDLND